MAPGKGPFLGARSQRPAHSICPGEGRGIAQLLRGFWEVQPDFVTNTETSVHREPSFSWPLPPHCTSAGARLCSKPPAPCGVGTQRPSCPGQNREKGELHSGGRGGRVIQAHELDVPAYCHSSCHHSHPSRLCLGPSHAPFRPRSALSAPCPWSPREGTNSVCHQIIRAATGGHGGSPRHPLIPSLSTPTSLPSQPREAPDPGGEGEGKESGPGAWFSFSCPESEPLWETSEGY